MIAVPTPFHADKFNKNTNSPIPNINHVISAAKKIAKYIKPGNLVLLESTSPVGTTDKIADTLKDAGVDIEEIFIAHSPERVLPGQIIKELVENDRLVGGINKKSTKLASNFYKSFVGGEVIETSAKTAEMAKLTENSFRDVNIAFANELSILCDDMDINVMELISLANKHPRVNILNPGCGVGGHCISVDPWFIVDQADGSAKLIEKARRINDHKREWVKDKIVDHIIKFQRNFNKTPSISCMGLSYKPDIDDLRESPALKISKDLSKLYKINVVEPNIRDIEGLNLINLDEALKMDICIYLVANKEFSNISLKESDLIFYGDSQ
jgi:UDP-N-acetyl-D-mannosaminuronic acid dehydrogenase